MKAACLWSPGDKWVGICNPGQGIWSGIEKSSEIGWDKKSLISTFACFLADNDMAGI